MGRTNGGSNYLAAPRTSSDDEHIDDILEDKDYENVDITRSPHY